MGRATQGVRLIKLSDDDSISSVEKIQKVEGETENGSEAEPNTENNNENNTTDETNN
jgi:DNA gyrase subunit A